ncbi:MAG: hypothetical protein WAL91_01630 [Propionicimonas sp.]
MTEPSAEATSVPQGDGVNVAPDEADEDDLEFQPRQRNGLHWLTIVLIALALWGAGFLVGVLTDRAFAGIAG